MCEICLQNPCPPGCPNADEPLVFTHCDECGAEIYDGEDFYKIGGNNYCESCIKTSYTPAEVPDYYED